MLAVIVGDCVVDGVVFESWGTIVGAVWIVFGACVEVNLVGEAVALGIDEVVTGESSSSGSSDSEGASVSTGKSTVVVSESASNVADAGQAEIRVVGEARKDVLATVDIATPCVW